MRKNNTSVMHGWQKAIGFGWNMGAGRPSGLSWIWCTWPQNRLYATGTYNQLIFYSCRFFKRKLFNITFCFGLQELALYGEFTLQETLIYFGWIAGMTTKDVEEKIDFLMKLLQLPNITRFVKNLSGGQQRRMSLAAALIHGMVVLFREKEYSTYIHILTCTKIYNKFMFLALFLNLYIRKLIQRVNNGFNCNFSVK